MPSAPSAATSPRNAANAGAYSSPKASMSAELPVMFSKTLKPARCPSLMKSPMAVRSAPTWNQNCPLTQVMPAACIALMVSASKANTWPPTGSGRSVSPRSRSPCAETRETLRKSRQKQVRSNLCVILHSSYCWKAIKPILSQEEPPEADAPSGGVFRVTERSVLARACYELRTLGVA